MQGAIDQGPKARYVIAMIEVPPQDPPSFEETVVERMVECGLNADGITVIHVSEHFYYDIVIETTANARESQFECIRLAAMGEQVLFEDEALRDSFDLHMEAYYRAEYERQRPQRLMELGEHLESHGLLEGFPRREAFADFADYVRALEEHAGLTGGEWLSADGEYVTFLPPEVAADQDPAQHYEQAVLLLAVIHYASMLDDIPRFGFVGNERYSNED